MGVYDHHVIVKDVDYVNKTLKLTGFDGPFPEDGWDAKVITNEKTFAELEGSLYKVVYGEREAQGKGKRS